MVARDMLPLHLANKTGIHNETIYRCLNGRRKWNLGHLELIAPVLGVKVGDLFKEPVKIPQAGKIVDGRGPTHDQILQDSQEGYLLNFQEDTATLSKMYCLSVADRSMVPTFPPDTKLIAQRGTSDSLKNENFVVYWAEDGNVYVRQLFLDHGQIILKSLTQGTPDRILPAKHLALCDKILQIIF